MEGANTVGVSDRANARTTISHGPLPGISDLTTLSFEGVDTMQGESLPSSFGNQSVSIEHTTLALLTYRMEWVSRTPPRQQSAYSLNYDGPCFEIGAAVNPIPKRYCV
jgi:hypothetical protein